MQQLYRLGRRRFMGSATPRIPAGLPIDSDEHYRLSRASASASALATRVVDGYLDSLRRARFPTGPAAVDHAANALARDGLKVDDLALEEGRPSLAPHQRWRPPDGCSLDCSTAATSVNSSDSLSQRRTERMVASRGLPWVKRRPSYRRPGCRLARAVPKLRHCVPGRPRSPPDPSPTMIGHRRCQT